MSAWNAAEVRKRDVVERTVAELEQELGTRLDPCKRATVERLLDAMGQEWPLTRYREY
jgi:hypothetical protein